MKKSHGFQIDFIIPLAAAALFSLLNLAPFFQSGETRMYDLLLHFKPRVPQEESILFVKIDDLAIEKIGMFPWSRDIMADGLILMKELDAGYAVFDIEYSEESPLGVNSELLNQEIPEVFNREFAELNGFIIDLFTALRMGQISLRDAEDYINELSGLTQMSKQVLLDKVGEIVKNNDIYLGRAARFFGNSFFTVNLFEIQEGEAPATKDYVMEEVPLENASAAYDFPFEYQGMRPAIRPIIEGARGAGFVNVIIDPDGVMRRIDLVREHRGKYFGQLAFTPLMHWLGHPEIVLRKGRIDIRGARMPSGEQRDISIPLADDGKFLINWPKTRFLDSFRHMSYYELVLHGRLEENLIHNLNLLAETGTLELIGRSGLLAPYQEAEAIKNEVLEGADTALVEQYRGRRADFFASVGELLDGSAEQEIMAGLDQLLASEGLSDDYRQIITDLQSDIPQIFGNTRDIHKNLSTSRSRLREKLPGSFCILGWTGTSTTDIGVNPFEEEYMNVGTHASVMNAILAGSFLDHLPWWHSAIAALLLAFLVTFIIRDMEPLPSVIVGMILLVLVLVGGSLFFVLTGVYMNLLTPSLTVFLTFLVITVFKFIRTEQERSYIRNAFSHYLSTDVIDDILSDPDKLALGGDQKHMTAIFTDVRGFSTISEQLTAPDLVRLLNQYLTAMSDIILELRGTVDKYEGDAIIAFFGAPIEFDDHARRACLSAVRMKKMERDLNNEFVNSGLSPGPLFTRIGVNTGDMVVGNMGTTKKMDYTIMGSSVNLAARLEGVNKQYGTWILVSEDTYEAGGKDFVTRQMDQVRVVGINRPVRLYELVDEKGAADAKTLEAIEIFHRGHQHFENKSWSQAQADFEKVLQILPQDGPATVFRDRCRQYRKKPPPESWDGVFNLTVK